MDKILTVNQNEAVRFREIRALKNLFERQEFQMKYYSETLNKVFDSEEAC
jgi:hypothetical protein